jgi:hypothetical protein
VRAKRAAIRHSEGRVDDHDARSGFDEIGIYRRASALRAEPMNE